MPTKTVPFDASEFITTPEAQADLLADAFASGHAGYIAHALGIIAKARGVSKVAADAGVTREALYKGLTMDGDPKLSTVLGVSKALGFQITARVA
jgi:probable addiction module antidote protein